MDNYIKRNPPLFDFIDKLNKIKKAEFFSAFNLVFQTGSNAFIIKILLSYGLKTG